MEFFSSCHLKLLAMVRAKASSFLKPQKEEVKDHYLVVCLVSSWKRKEEEEESALVIMVAVLNGEDESSWVLLRVKVIVFESCLQRPKDVIFEGVSDEGLVMVVVEKGRRIWRRKRNYREKLRSLRVRERMKSCKNEVNVCVCACCCCCCCCCYSLLWAKGRYFAYFCAN